MALPEEVLKITKKINKKYGDDTLITADQGEKLKINWHTTGLSNLDLATKPNTGTGGIPQGRLIEIYGPQKSGKTSLCLSVIAEAQKEDKVCAFFDAENGYNPFFAKNVMGVSNEDLIISRTQAGETALNTIEAMIVSGTIDLIVLDSVAALPSEAILKEDMQQQHVAREARMWSQALKKIKGLMAKYNTTFILINQLREDPGTRYGNPIDTPGGNAIKFYSDMRIEVKSRDVYRTGSGDDREDIGHKIRFRIIKNKAGTSGGSAIADFYYDKGFNQEKILIDTALESGIIDQSGSWFTYEPLNETLGDFKEQGKDSLLDAMKEHDRYDEVLDDIRIRVNNPELTRGDFNESEDAHFVKAG